jgi:hypothetical protein
LYLTEEKNNYPRKERRSQGIRQEEQAIIRQLNNLKSELEKLELKRSTVINNHDTGSISYCSYLIPSLEKTPENARYFDKFLMIKSIVRRDGKKEIEPSHINELHVVFGMFRDFLPSRLVIDRFPDLKKSLDSIEDMLVFKFDLTDGTVLTFKKRVLTFYTDSKSPNTIRGSFSEGADVRIEKSDLNKTYSTTIIGQQGITELNDTEIKSRYGHFLNFKDL